MNMTKTFKKVGVLAIVLLMIAALVGCGGNQEEKQWEEDVTAIMNDITLSQTDFNTALAGIQPGDADSQTAMLNAIDTLEEDFNALKAVEAPEKYQAVRKNSTQPWIKLWKAQRHSVRWQTTSATAGI